MTNRLSDEHCATCRVYLFSWGYCESSDGKKYYCKKHQKKSSKRPKKKGRTP